MQLKKAAAISAGLHTAVLLWAVLSFSGKTLEATPAESLPVDFISEKDFSQITKGVKDAPKREKPKELVEKKADEPKPVEEHKTKVSDKPEIKPTAEKPPQPQPESKPGKKPDDKPQSKPDKQEKPESKEAKAPSKTPESVAADKTDPIAEKLQENNDKKRSKVAPAPPRRPKQVQNEPPRNEQPKFDATEIAALLNNQEPRRNAAAGQTLDPDATLGRANGAASQLSQSELAAFQARVQQCWQPPRGAEEQDVEVVLRVLFNRDGTVKRAPEVVEGSPSALGPVFAESARRAILACQPYTMLRPEHYDQWKDMEALFNLSDMLR